MKETALNVELLSHTGGEKVVALAAKLCYSSADISDLKENVSKNDQEKFIAMLSSMGHHSVLEHVSFTFGIEGVSRALTHQLVRHRIASYSQKSQRYVSHESGFDYVLPSFRYEDGATDGNEAEIKAKFEELMQSISAGYTQLIDMGAKPEDARYLLPNASETKIVMTMNARSLLNFFRLRCCNRAQWEIRDLAIEVLKIVKKEAPSIFKGAGPACVAGACVEGKMTCGKAKEVREFFKTLK